MAASIYFKSGSLISALVRWTSGFCRFSLFQGNDLAFAALGLDFCPSRSAECMGRNDQFPGQIAGAKNLDQVGTAIGIGQAALAQCILVNARTFVELIERFQVHRQIARAVAFIIEPAFGNAPNQRHLAAFEPNSNRAARSRGLAFATASASLAVTAGFTLT